MKIFLVIPDTVLGIRPAGEAYVERMRCGWAAVVDCSACFGLRSVDAIAFRRLFGILGSPFSRHSCLSSVVRCSSPFVQLTTWYWVIKITQIRIPSWASARHNSLFVGCSVFWTLHSADGFCFCWLFSILRSPFSQHRSFLSAVRCSSHFVQSTPSPFLGWTNHPNQPNANRKGSRRSGSLICVD